LATNKDAPGPPPRAPPPAAWARAQRERDKRGLALAPRVHATIRLPPKAYHLATNEGAPGPPPRAPPPAAWARAQRERDKRGLAWWATLTRGLHPRADAFLPCGLPSRVGYSHPRADAFSPCGLPSCVGYTTRRCFLALWATVTRGLPVTRELRSHQRAAAFLPCGLPSCVGHALWQNPHEWGLGGELL